MFGGLLSARLKAAENALEGGRLDEAFRLASARDLCDQRRAKAVLTELTDRFIERARAQFREERFAEAASDLDKAAFGGTRTEEIAELRKHVATVAAEVRRQEVSRRERVDAARRRLDAGSLAAGRNILAGAPESDHEANRLREDAERREREVRGAAAEIEGLIKQGLLGKAVQRLASAQRINAHDPSLMALESRMVGQVLDAARSALKDGRPGRAASELKSLGALGEGTVARRELEDMLSRAKAAGDAARAHDYDTAREHMLALGRLMPGAKWIEKAVEQLRQLDEIGTALRAGPLGEPIDGKVVKAAARVVSCREPARNLDETIAVSPGGGEIGDGLPDRLLMLVDGGGSYLILRGDRVSIGRAASNQPADVAIYSDIAERHAQIARVEEDYFLFGSRDVEVAGRMTRHQLLRDGDRVVLAKRAKFGFRLPSRKSLSAVLDLSDTTKMPNDVRRVILFDRHVGIGAGSTAHVRCPQAQQSMVLFVRDGEMWLRPQSGVGGRGAGGVDAGGRAGIGGHGEADAIRVEIGERIEHGGVSFVVEPWHVQSFGTTRL